MHKHNIEETWKALSGKAKPQWGKLADDPLDVIAAKRDLLEQEVQQAYRIIKAAAG